MTQLFMRIDNLENLPEIVLPEGVTLKTHKEGMEKDWEALIEASFGTHYSFETMLTNWKGYAPDCVFYMVKDGKLISTASAVENADFEGEGWLHMVGTHPESRGLGAGKIATLAVLHSFKDRGYKSVVLSTDDERIPAIATYLKLGFKPIFTDDTHEGRWAKVMQQIKM
ncbi:MAG: GNAT family N-acetyltransferase [Clostridia bacterium]|nr:GNAT family N-acetyltransferase [Clostridia bacterium]